MSSLSSPGALPRRGGRRKVVAPGTNDEAGPTWTVVFPKGDIGVMPSTTLGLMLKGLDVGVAPIRGDLGAQRELTRCGGTRLGQVGAVVLPVGSMAAAAGSSIAGPPEPGADV